MPLEIQSKLLGALQDRQIYRVGGASPVKIDIRVIAATNRDLQAEVAAGRFRQDLFYRLNVVSLHLPPLRERVEDVLALAEHLIQFLCAEIRSQYQLSESGSSRHDPALFLARQYSGTGERHRTGCAFEQRPGARDGQRIGLQSEIEQSSEPRVTILASSRARSPLIKWNSATSARLWRSPDGGFQDEKERLRFWDCIRTRCAARWSASGSGIRRPRPERRNFSKDFISAAWHSTGDASRRRLALPAVSRRCVSEGTSSLSQTSRAPPGFRGTVPQRRFIV